MDMTESIAPKSDQMDYEDLLGGERTFTILEVRKGPSADQPVEVVLDRFPRPWRPAKSMRRVMVAAWGPDAAAYIGKQVQLFGDPDVTWAGQAVGGIRIKALSDIASTLTVALTVTRGRRAPFVVQPLNPPKDTSGRDWLTELTAADGNPDAIRALGIAAKNANALPAVLTVIRQAFEDAKTVGQPVAVPANGDQQ